MWWLCTGSEVKLEMLILLKILLCSVNCIRHVFVWLSYHCSKQYLYALLILYALDSINYSVINNRINSIPILQERPAEWEWAVTQLLPSPNSILQTSAELPGYEGDPSQYCRPKSYWSAQRGIRGTIAAMHRSEFSADSYPVCKWLECNLPVEH